MTEQRPDKLLVVDDEVDIAQLLSTGLRFLGFDVRTAHSGVEALQIAAEFRPDLLVLDVTLPDVNGFDLCRQIRRERDQVGVVFLTARDRTEDAIAGLTVGGDDYINKPFSLDEVVARVRAVLRRITTDGGAGARGVDDGVLRFADLEMDQVRYEVRRASGPIDLSPTEFSLLRYLLQNSGQVVSKTQILEHVWSYDFRGGPQIVESYISYLRKKVDRCDLPLIHTLRGVGYTLRVGRAAMAEGLK
jgi:two-component system OmpR family response regulator